MIPTWLINLQSGSWSGSGFRSKSKSGSKSGSWSGSWFMSIYGAKSRSWLWDSEGASDSSRTKHRNMSVSRSR